VNDINFSIEINTINNFLNNRAQTLNDYNLETEGVRFFFFYKIEGVRCNVWK